VQFAADSRLASRVAIKIKRACSASAHCCCHMSVVQVACNLESKGKLCMRIGAYARLRPLRAEPAPSLDTAQPQPLVPPPAYAVPHPVTSSRQLV
jgi:hypothetical protein